MNETGNSQGLSAKSVPSNEDFIALIKRRPKVAARPSRTTDETLRCHIRHYDLNRTRGLYGAKVLEDIRKRLSERNG